MTFKEIAVANEFPFFLTFMFLQSVPNCRHHFPATFYPVPDCLQLCVYDKKCRQSTYLIPGGRELNKCSRAFLPGTS